MTRARDQAPALAAGLSEAGADVVTVPVVLLRPPADGGAAMREAAAAVRAGAYDWVVLTSANAVERFLPLLGDARDLGRARVAAIGPGTAGALDGRGVAADLVPDRHVAEGLLEAFPRPPPGGARVLLPRAAVGRDVLPDGLRAAGWEVDVVEAYRTARPAVPPDLLARARSADAITFTAASTVAAWDEAAGAGATPPLVACIGPVTAAEAEGRGMRVDVVAETHTVDGLVAALVAEARRRGARGGRGGIRDSVADGC